MNTLDDFNAKRQKEYDFISRPYPRKNGIECPKCKQELSDADSSVLTSIPPQKNTVCESCGYRGYRIA